jgi:hypothetical protein
MGVDIDVVARSRCPYDLKGPLRCIDEHAELVIGPIPIFREFYLDDLAGLQSLFTANAQTRFQADHLPDATRVIVRTRLSSGTRVSNVGAVGYPPYDAASVAVCSYSAYACGTRSRTCSCEAASPTCCRAHSRGACTSGSATAATPASSTTSRTRCLQVFDFEAMRAYPVMLEPLLF